MIIAFFVSIWKGLSRSTHISKVTKYHTFAVIMVNLRTPNFKPNISWMYREMKYTRVSVHILDIKNGNKNHQALLMFFKEL